MRKIGLLGGTSYPSTILYYQLLNELYNKKLGGHHSCPLLLYNIDYHEIKSRYHSGWDEIPQLLKLELENLLSLNPSGIIICNNTLHKAYDLIKNDLDLQVPIFHILELTSNYIRKNNLLEVLLLGTKFTMQDKFFKDYLRNDGIKVVVPDDNEMNEIQRIQTDLSKGKNDDSYIRYFKNLSEKYNYCNGIILGCTELPIVFNSIKTRAVKINTIELQCKKAIDFITK